MCEPQSGNTLSPPDYVDVDEEPTQNVPEATEEPCVGEVQSGRTTPTPGDVVVVEEPTQHVLVEFKRAAAIASTHGTLDGVVVDEVLMQDVPEEPEEPGVDEEITLTAPEIEEEVRAVYRRQGLPTHIVIDAILA